jgi:CubicO group peptidase (beta-lactamase class C family)
MFRIKNFSFAFCFIFLTALGLQAQTYFPEKNNWAHKSPEALGIDAAKIAKAVAFAEASEIPQPRDLRLAIIKGFEREPYHKLLGPVKKRGGTAGMIIKDGYIIAQWGDTQRVDMTFSVTKSFLSTVAGLAVDSGLIKNVNDTVVNYVWDGTFDGAHNSSITWKHLLNQSSDWSGQLWGSYDWADRPARNGDIDSWKNRELHKPGTFFKYNDVRVNVLSYSLLQVFRRPLPQVLKESVMDPIGASTTWRWFGYDNSYTLVDGVQMQSVSGGGHSGGGLFINTEDMARFGLLFLNKGKWKNQQLISEKWIQEATASSTANANYGYMWWLNKDVATSNFSNLSPNGYYASGFGGNHIFVEAEHQLLIVVRWFDYEKSNEFVKMVKDAMP